MIWKFDINPKKRTGNWPLQSAGFFSTAPVFYRNRIYIALGTYREFGEQPGRLVCLDPSKTGDISLELEDGPGQAKPNPNTGALWHFDGIRRMMGGVGIDNGLVIAPDFAGNVHCLDAETGQLYWTHDLRAIVYGSPLIADGKVYIGDEDGDQAILALAKTKQVISQKLATTWISSAAIFANGALYFSAGDTLYAIEDRSPSWVQWRGPDRSNASKETGLLREWPPAGPARLWTVSGLGDNIHSVAIAQGKVFTVGNREGSEFVVGFNEATGEQAWISRVGPAIEENSRMRWLSQRAPTLDDSRMYWLTLKGELVCLSTANGAEIWRKNYLSEFGASPSVWGYCDFPFVDGPALICTPLGTNAALASLDKATGVLLWKTLFDGKPRSSYAPTLVTEIAGIRQYVVSSSVGLFGVGTADGKRLWQFDRPTRLSASTYTPAVYRDLICSPNGYASGIVGIQVTREANEILAREKYRIALKLTPFQDSTARVSDRFYLGQSNLLCLDLNSGNLLWGETR